MASPDDVGNRLSRIEGMLTVALANHDTRLGEHGRTLELLDERLRELEKGQASTAGAHRLPNWVPTVAALATVAAILVTIFIASRK